MANDEFPLTVLTLSQTLVWISGAQVITNAHARDV